MTQQQTEPAPKVEEPPKSEEAKKPRVYSEEEWNKNQSKLQRQVTGAERERDEARQAVSKINADLQALREELELSGLTDEDERKVRQAIAKDRRELAQEKERMAGATQELRRRVKELLAGEKAQEYGVSKEELMELDTAEEMDIAGLKAQNARLLAEKAKPAPKAPAEPAPAHESGESLIPRKRVEDMTEKEFGEYWPQFKSDNAARNAAAS